MPKKKSNERSALMERLEESAVLERLAENWKNLLLVAAGVVILIVALFKMGAQEKTHAEQDYLAAERDYRLFINPESRERGEALQSLEAIIGKRPELASKYEGAVAQALLNRGEVKEARPMIENSLARTARDGLPFYTIFSKNALLIEEKRYEEALNASKNLKNQMVENNRLALEKGERLFGETLFAYNLLRIAALEQKAGTAPAERTAWQEFLQYAGLAKGEPPVKGFDPEPFKEAARSITSGGATLLDYIEFRKKTLKN